jgi:hypothetical protein
MTNSVWDTYPADYRAAEVRASLAALRAGESVSLVGLSGAGKSNLTGFLAHRHSPPEHPLVLVDCNRLAEPAPAALFRLIRRALGDTETAADEWEALDAALIKRLTPPASSLGLIFDRFDALVAQPALFSNLRALRDAHKFQLAFILATRRPLDPHTELSELVYAHTLWLGPLSEGDARWNVTRYAARRGVAWGDDVAEALIRASGGYPAFLRAASEAHAEGAALDAASLAAYPAVQRRLAEFWADHPTPDELRQSGLENVPLLDATQPAAEAITAVDTTRFTAKENSLWRYLQAHPNEVCEKDDLIRAVWPEDKIFEKGVRDDSLAQLVRRLREKIEPDPSNPRHLHTVPGRGYRFTG